MPIYMDLHIVPGITAKAAAEAHRKDLDVEAFFGCRTMTYWVDEDRGSAFCLIEAPDKEAVHKMHNKAHGLIPHEIIEVEQSVVKAFLGRIHDPDALDSDSDLQVFNDPAFRTVMFMQTEDEGLLKHRHSTAKIREAFDIINDAVENSVQEFEGNLVDIETSGKVISFNTSLQAVDCAMNIQDAVGKIGELVGLRLGIHAGVPVDQSNEKIFGSTLRMANYLSWIGGKNQIVPSSLVREFCGFSFQKNTENKHRFLDKKDEIFLESLMNLVNDRGLNPDFDISVMVDELAVSRAQLYRKCKKITKMSPNELIKEYRLRKSLEVLRKNASTIAETAFEVGFASPSYFTRCFSERFDVFPSALVTA